MMLPMAPRARAGCQIIDELDRSPRLRIAWNDLWRRAGGHYHEDYATAAHCWEQMAKPAGHKLLCVLLWNEDRLVAAWPLVKFHMGPLRLIKPLTPCGGEAYSILVDPEADISEVVATAWEKVRLDGRCDILYLPSVRADSPLNGAMPGSSRYLSRQDVAPFANLAGVLNWNAYCQMLAPGLRKEMDSKHRKLRESPGSEVIWLDPLINPEMAIKLVDWMLEEKQKWVKRAGKKYTWIESPLFREFLVRSMTDPNQIVKYLLCVIQVNARPIAGTLVAFCARHIEGIIAAFDPDSSCSRLSPGSILVEHVMKLAYQMRLNVDFGTGAEAYKLFWSRGNKVELRTYHFPLTRRGEFSLAVRRRLRQTRGKLA